MQVKLHIKLIILFLLIGVFLSQKIYSQPVVSFTFDDPDTKGFPLLSAEERNIKILETLDKYHLHSTLFVCGHRVTDEYGRKLISSWDEKGHQIANHSFDHKYYHSAKFSFEDFKNDFFKNDSLISFYTNYTRLFRFPFLKEGDTKEKRDSARALLKKNGYRNGYVSIDASDWYVNQLLMDTLTKNISANTDIYKQLYIDHILERADFYDSLATLITGRKVKHILLLHHNLTSALFLGDLIVAFKNKNWKILSSSEAWGDPVYDELPDILPSAESIIWALAKESGKYEELLRYPGEDSSYEEEKFRKFLDRRLH